ncbi:hypothetical protein DKT75_11630 [Leucothrix arctica]|uniref:ABM domain-containing protein n=1 Tax=Leucothrix arctica TaxID=1481894 RepID=A0A317CBL7_9GAMM|nr:hypothetical protein DKT75_11630 [Leucothrix arctica]
MFSTSVWATGTGAYLQINLKISDENRPAAAEIYKKYKQPFLEKIENSTSKALLINEGNVQVLHGFKDTASAEAYLATELFKNDVVRELKPLLEASPEITIYQAM